MCCFLVLIHPLLCFIFILLLPVVILLLFVVILTLSGVIWFLFVVVFVCHFMLPLCPSSHNNKSDTSFQTDDLSERLLNAVTQKERSFQYSLFAFIKTIFVFFLQ